MNNPKECSANDCDRQLGKRGVRGLCGAHYSRLRRGVSLDGPVAIRRGDESERFFNKVHPEPNSGCWLWSGAADYQGYGHFYARGKTTQAHRWAYEHSGKIIPNDLCLDHLCRTPSCVNPSHLELVTVRENTLRGIGPSAVSARRSACARGHKYTPETLHVTSRGWRVCRICRATSARKYREARKL